MVVKLTVRGLTAPSNVHDDDGDDQNRALSDYVRHCMDGMAPRMQ